MLLVRGTQLFWVSLPWTVLVRVFQTTGANVPDYVSAAKQPGVALGGPVPELRSHA
jgi:hypothetical protein